MHSMKHLTLFWNNDRHVRFSSCQSFCIIPASSFTFHSGLLLKFIWTCSSSFGTDCDTTTLMLRSFKGSNSPDVFGLSSSLRFIHSSSCHIRTEKESPSQIPFVCSQCHYMSCLAYYFGWKYASNEFWIWLIKLMLCIAAFLLAEVIEALRLTSVFCDTVTKRASSVTY